MSLQRLGSTVVGLLVLAAAVPAAWFLLSRDNLSSAAGEPPRLTADESALARTPVALGTVRISPAERKALGLDTAAAESGSRPVRLRMSATTALDPDGLAHLHTRFGGEVTEVRARLGQSVKKGDLLAVVWSKDLGEKKSEYVDTRSQLKLNQEVLHRLEGAFQKGAIPERTYLQALRDVESARIAADRAYRTLISWRLRPEEIQAIDREKDTDWPKEHVRAPIDGIIAEKNIVPGELVDPTVNLFVLADLSRIAIWAYAHEEDLPRLHGGQRWSVAVKALPGQKLKGRIGVIGTVVDPNQHTATVQGTVPNPGEVLRGGMFATATVTLPAEPGQVTVPTSALIDLEDGTFVYVESDQTPDEFARRRVRVRERLHGEAVLSEGVQPGEAVVSRAALELHQKAVAAND